MRAKIQLRLEVSPSHLFAALGRVEVDSDTYFTMLSRCRPNLLKSPLRAKSELERAPLGGGVGLKNDSQGSRVQRRELEGIY